MSALLRIADVAEALGVSANTAYGMAQKGEIPAFKIAGKWRVRAEALDQWIRAQAKEAEDFSNGLKG